MRMIDWFRALVACALALGATSAMAQVQTLAPPVVEGAAKARVEVIKVHSTAIAGNLLATPADREVIVILPPGYDANATRRYPVVYALHGYSIGASQWIGEIRLPQTAEADVEFASSVRCRQHFCGHRNTLQPHAYTRHDLVGVQPFAAPSAGPAT